MFGTNREWILPPLIPGIVVAALVTAPLQAQQSEDLGTLVTNSLTAMNAGKWEEAHALLTQAVERYGKNQPLKLFGPRFGVIYYRKGICEMRLGKPKEAMESFERCATDFPNTGENVAGGGNLFEKRALLKWGEAAMGAEEWELAISKFEQFVKERDRGRDSYPVGTFHINMAICHYKLSKLSEGTKHLEDALDNREKYHTADAAIISGFQALVEAAINSRNEKALLDFIGKNRGAIIIEPFEIAPFTNNLMKLAADAVSAEMPGAALALYQLVPPSALVLEDTEARVRALAGRPGTRDGQRTINRQRLEKNIELLKARQTKSRVTDVIRLAATAYIHESNGNIRGAYAAYEQLEQLYPKAEKREDNLFHLVRTSSIVGDVVSTERQGRKFLAAYPDSPHVPAVRRMMLSSLFYEGHYQDCIKVASSMIEQLEPGSAEHDICLHVLGGSYYYTGSYDKAQPLLDEHVEKYPESNFLIAAKYFQASNLSRLQFWSKAASLLDKFLAEHPEPSKNPFYQVALYDRANCHYAEDQNEAALEKLADLEARFPNGETLEMALNLKGNVHQSLGNPDLAESAYLAALELAERRDNRTVASEALYYLVAMLGDKKQADAENPRFKDAVAHADKFWKEYGDDSPYKTQVAVAQVHALDSVDRGEEALEKLRGVIAAIATSEEAFGIEEALNSYTEVYLAKHTPEELKEHYYDFPGIRASDRAARALLRIAVIGVFEDVAKKSDDEARQRSASAMIQVLFQELKSEFAPKDLTNFILVKLGDYLRVNTSSPREALPYYDEILGRQDASYRFPALFGRGEILARSGNPADLDKAIEDFQRVYNDSQDRAERENALYQLTAAYLAKGDHAKTQETARIYLDRDKTNFTKFAPEVGMLLARSYQESGNRDEAIASYVKVWSSHMGRVSVSAPAMKTWMELSWARNHPGDGASRPPDRQGAYENGARYIELTSRFLDKLSEEELAEWKAVESLVATYEADPNIKSVAEIEREKKSGR